MNYNIAYPFFESAQKYPEKLALFADGETYTYREMLDRVVRVADWLSTGDEGPAKQVGIFASRSAEACIGILAAAWVGAAYVPISLKLPELGVASLLKRANFDALLADRAGSRMMTPRILEEAPAKVLAVGETIPFGVNGKVRLFEALTSAGRFGEPSPSRADSLAYVLYTSGSSGKPKGVMIPSGALNQLLNAMETKYPLSHDDRVAETTDTSFDLSVYNMFATWRAGASLHVIPATQVMAPVKFIRDHQITSWLSVPSVAALMSRMGLLKRGAVPSLRYTFFAGEPLLVDVAEAWQMAAPLSVVVNMYGPTEATVMCLGQEYVSRSTFTRDCVAIGQPFPGMRIMIAEVAEGTTFAAAGKRGELLLAGLQLALGYLDDLVETTSRFVTLDGERWYRTGDFVSSDERGVVHYLGRIDNQVKILGYRVELEEIEHLLRKSSGSIEVAAVAWPLQGGTASGVVAFLVNSKESGERVKADLQERLPPYMVPTKVYIIRELPLNDRGKVDRGALLTMLRTAQIV